MLFSKNHHDSRHPLSTMINLFHCFEEDPEATYMVRVTNRGGLQTIIASESSPKRTLLPQYSSRVTPYGERNSQDSEMMYRSKKKQQVGLFGRLINEMEERGASRNIENGQSEQKELALRLAENCVKLEARNTPDEPSWRKPENDETQQRKEINQDKQISQIDMDFSFDEINNQLSRRKTIKDESNQHVAKQPHDQKKTKMNSPEKNILDSPTKTLPPTQQVTNLVEKKVGQKQPNRAKQVVKISSLKKLKEVITKRTEYPKQASQKKIPSKQVKLEACPEVIVTPPVETEKKQADSEFSSLRNAKQVESHIYEVPRPKEQDILIDFDIDLNFV